MLRRTFLLALKAETVKDLVRYADVYGRGCLRLMRLLKAQGAAGGHLVEYLQESIDLAITEINEEWGIDLPR